MDFDRTIGKVAKDVFLYVCYKFELINYEPMPESCFISVITVQLMKNLSETVCMHILRNERVWEKFFNEHLGCMSSSPYLFVTYIAYACYVLIRDSDAYDQFLETLSFVTHFAALCWQKGEEVYINICLALFFEFFEKEIQAKFEEQGSWQNLNDYLLKHYSLKPYVKTYKTKIIKNISLSERFQSIKYDTDGGNNLLDEANGVQLKGISRRQVETHKKAVQFFNSVSNKMEVLFQQTFGKISPNFVNADDQSPKLCRETVEATSGCMAKNGDQSTSRELGEEASGSIPDTTKTVEQPIEKQTAAASGSAETLKEETVKFQDGFSPAARLNPKFGKSEKAKELLDCLSLDIGKLAGLVQSLCDEHGVQNPIVGKQTLRYRTP